MIDIQNFINKLGDKIRTSQNQKEAAKLQKAINNYVSDCSKRIDIYAGLNMQDSRLTQMLLDKHIQEKGDNLSDVEITEISAMLEIANAQNKYNEGIILGADLSGQVKEDYNPDPSFYEKCNPEEAKKVTAIFGNQAFEVASQAILKNAINKENRNAMGFESHVHADKFGSTYVIVNPDRTREDIEDIWENDPSKNFKRIVDKHHVQFSRARIQHLLKGLDQNQQTEKLTEIFGCEKSAHMYIEKLNCPKLNKKAQLEHDCALYAVRQEASEKMVEQMLSKTAERTM